MAKKNKKTPKEPKTEKITVTDISQPSNAELSLEIAALNERIDRIVVAHGKAKSLKGM